MEIVAGQHLQFPPKPQCLITTPLSSKLSPSLLRLTLAACRRFATISAAAPTTTARDPEGVTLSEPVTPKPRPNGSSRGTSRFEKVSLDARQLKLNWLDSLSCPFPANCGNRVSEGSEYESLDSGWVIGVDPDISGALAVSKPDNSVQVFDSPHLEVLVGKRVRKRLDVKSIIQLLQNVDAPIGTTVYIEQSIPYPQDGKQDDSRELASTVFPSMSSLLKRKKDHGWAEAVLIAAYGKGLKVNYDTTCILEDLMPQKQSPEAT